MREQRLEQREQVAAELEAALLSRESDLSSYVAQLQAAWWAWQAVGRSLLPVGVRRVEGTFRAGDAVRVCTLDGDPFAGVRPSAASSARRSSTRRWSASRRRSGYESSSSSLPASSSPANASGSAAAKPRTKRSRSSSHGLGCRGDGSEISVAALPFFGAVFLLGLAGFGIMSALCGLAPNLETLVVLRVLQGGRAHGLEIAQSIERLQVAEGPGHPEEVGHLEHGRDRDPSGR